MSDSELSRIVAELRRFATWSPATEQDLSQWCEEAQEMHALMRAAGNFADDERYWHYMSDADIRARDARYKSAQDQIFLDFITEIERRFPEVSRQRES